MRVGRRVGLAAGLVVIAATVWIGPTSAATYVVSPQGNDTNPGTAAAPFRTLAKACGVVTAGDTVRVRPGTYPGAINLTRSATADQPIVVCADGSGPVRVVGRIDPVKGFTPAEGRQHTYVVDEPGPVGAVAVDLDTTPIVMEPMSRVDGADAVEAGNYRYFHDTSAGKLYLRYDGANPQPKHTVHVLRDGYGMHLGGAHLIVDGLTFVGFAGHAISIGGSRHVTVTRCHASLTGFAWGAGVGLCQAQSATVSHCTLYRLMNGIIANQVTDTRFVHNTIYRTRAHGIIVYGGPNNRIENNILYAGGRSGGALYVGAGGDVGLHLDHNCYLDYQCRNLIAWTPAKGQYPTFWDYRAAHQDQDRHSINDDPLFVSTRQGAEDLRLQPASPCRGKASDGQDMGVVFAAPQATE